MSDRLFGQAMSGVRRTGSREGADQQGPPRPAAFSPQSPEQESYGPARPPASIHIRGRASSLNVPETAVEEAIARAEATAAGLPPSRPPAPPPDMFVPPTHGNHNRRTSQPKADRPELPAKPKDAMSAAFPGMKQIRKPPTHFSKPSSSASPTKPNNDSPGSSAPPPSATTFSKSTLSKTSSIINRKPKYDLDGSAIPPSPPPTTLPAKDLPRRDSVDATAPSHRRALLSSGSEDGELVEDEQPVNESDGGSVKRSPTRDESGSKSVERSENGAGPSKIGAPEAGGWDQPASSSSYQDRRGGPNYQNDYRGDYSRPPPPGNGRDDGGWAGGPSRDDRGRAGGSSYRGGDVDRRNDFQGRPFEKGKFNPPMAERDHHNLPPPPGAGGQSYRPGQPDFPGRDSRGGPSPLPRKSPYGSGGPQPLPPVRLGFGTGPGPTPPFQSYDRPHDNRPREDQYRGDRFRPDERLDRPRDPARLSSSQSSSFSDDRSRDDRRDRDRDYDRRGDDRDSSYRRDRRDEYPRVGDDRRSGGDRYGDDSSSSRHKSKRDEDERPDQQRKRQKTGEDDDNPRAESSFSSQRHDSRRDDRDRSSRRGSRSPSRRRKSSRSRSRSRSPRPQQESAKSPGTPEGSPPPSPEKQLTALPAAPPLAGLPQLEMPAVDLYGDLADTEMTDETVPSYVRLSNGTERSPAKRRRSPSPPKSAPRPPPPPPAGRAPSSPPPPPAHSPPPAPPAPDSPTYKPASPVDTQVLSPTLLHASSSSQPSKSAHPTPNPSRPLPASVSQLVEPPTASTSSHRSAPSTRPATPSSSAPGVKKKRRGPRTAEQETTAYGHAFAGTSDPSKYPIAGKLGEGTFGEVHKSTCAVTGRVVALKRILVHSENDGVPITTLREIKLLKALSHPNVVPVVDMILAPGDESTQNRGKIFMVFPFADHDLAGLLENTQVNWDHKLIKLYSMQLLRGTHYLHSNSILHRDMKTANLLINNQGVLQIADFGLARSFSAGGKRGGSTEKDGKEYTNMVVTRWYRPPELLLGLKTYGPSIDIWGVGCVIAEMITKRPIMQGNSDQEQLTKIYELCGSPDDHNMPAGWRQWSGCEGSFMFPNRPIPRGVVKKFKENGTMFADLIDRLLTMDPHKRISAREALDHDYFWSVPLPMKPEDLPQDWKSSHEMTRKKKTVYQPPPQQIAPQPIPPPRLLPGQAPPGGYPNYPPPGFPIQQQPNMPFGQQQQAYGGMPQMGVAFGGQPGYQQPGFQQQPQMPYGQPQQPYNNNGITRPGAYQPQPPRPNPYAQTGTSNLNAPSAGPPRQQGQATTRAPQNVYRVNTTGTRPPAGVGAGFLKPKPSGAPAGMTFGKPPPGGSGSGGPRAGRGGPSGSGGGGGNGGLPYN